MTVSVLYVGTTWPGSTTAQRRAALESLGCTVDCVDTGWRQKNPPLPKRAVRGVFRRLGYPRELQNENRDILGSLRSQPFDVLWIDKGLTIRPETICKARKYSPGIVIVSFSADDMANPQNQSRYYLKCLPHYDLVVTTKLPNRTELAELGAPRVMQIDNGFDLSTHRPVDLTSEERAEFGADVSFVGGYEKARADSLCWLASQGVSVRVWGNRWHLLAERPANLRIEQRPVFGDDYARVLCASKINLAYLRKVNRDTQTTRTMEIPACGAFMLAERTEDHMRLFEEGKEAAFFSSDDELISQIRKYLADDEKRRRIARAAFDRCISSGYSNRDQLTAVLRQCESIAESFHKAVAF
ncbi:glycosyltransferase [Pseudomonadota bacterium]